MKAISKALFITLSLILLSACGSNGATAPRAIIGDVGSPVTIEEFSDYQCPACGQVSPQIEEIARANPGLVRLEFRHFPLPQHENAFGAAVGAECANLQGKFWEFGNIAFKNQDSLTTDNLKEFAKNLGLDIAAFNECLDANQTAGRVRDDLSLGRIRGVSFTPSLYVNGKLVQFTSREAFEGYVKNLR